MRYRYIYKHDRDVFEIHIKISLENGRLVLKITCHDVKSDLI